MKKETPQDRYARKNIVCISIRLNKKTDADLIDRLNKVGNKQGYIKKLIRNDLANEKPPFKEALKSLLDEYEEK